MVKRIILLFSLLLLAFLVVKVAKLDKDERFLNYFAKYYFDEQYYVVHYPEILEQKIDPFEHYVTVGWKQGKNPNSEFDIHHRICYSSSAQFLSWVVTSPMNMAQKMVTSKYWMPSKRKRMGSIPSCTSTRKVANVLRLPANPSTTLARSSRQLFPPTPAEGTSRQIALSSKNNNAVTNDVTIVANAKVRKALTDGATFSSDDDEDEDDDDDDDEEEDDDEGDAFLLESLLSSSSSPKTRHLEPSKA